MKTGEKHSPKNRERNHVQKTRERNHVQKLLLVLLLVFSTLLRSKWWYRHAKGTYISMVFNNGEMENY